VSPNRAMTTAGRSLAYGRRPQILSPVLSPVTKRLTDDAATSCTLCRVETSSRQMSPPADSTTGEACLPKLGPNHLFFPVNFTGILFEIDSFLATRNADHSVLGEGVPV
jgi:hypothetical protein